MTALSVHRAPAEERAMDAEAHGHVPSRLIFKSVFGFGMAALITFSAVAPIFGVHPDVLTSGGIAALGALAGALLAMRTR